MTKSITLVALVCLLVVGAAATSILTRDSVPVAGIGMPAVVAKSPISNREAKGDRLTVNRPVASAEEQPSTPAVSESVRNALAYAPADAEVPMPTKPATPAVMAQAPADQVPAVQVPAAQVAPVQSPAVQAPAAVAEAPSAPAEVMAPRPKPVVQATLKPEVQKAYALLSDGQIAGIKERLKLSSSQEYYWPAVETALRAVAKKIHSTRQAANTKPSVQIDPDSDEVQQLKSAAMPLLWQLRDDQKDEVRKLARLIGLDKVASAI